MAGCAHLIPSMYAMDHELRRFKSRQATTFGRLLTEGKLVCYTLEDQIREIAGEPVESWKVYGQTAIPSGRYRIEFRNSPKYGPDTLTLANVPGYEHIRMHSGSHHGHTEGCLIVGDQINPQLMTIHGGKLRGVVEMLKRHFKQWPENWLTIINTEDTI